MPTEWPDPFEDRVMANPVEWQIREAMGRGEFERLSGSGKPLPDVDASYDPGWWAKKWVERSRLEDEVRELSKLVTAETPRLRAARDRASARHRAGELNEMIAGLNERLPEVERLSRLDLGDDG
jgi:hypothetical protein